MPVLISLPGSRPLRSGLVGAVHQLAVDHSGRFELLDGAAELVLGLEELLFENVDALGELRVGQLGDHVIG